ncbi:hypothetical protein [Bradyrhizobium sp. CCBAU 11361]|uniref:hypothetical protein n=1 Tax=Bradyrhizobium sp. CCBAU 11361 TaxID=1630812 RepID=UPI0023035A15|nr:hypothetical protein [Bradyrhizobium sp. CCBAU 11361]
MEQIARARRFAAAMNTAADRSASIRWRSSRQASSSLRRSATSAARSASSVLAIALPSCFFLAFGGHREISGFPRLLGNGHRIACQEARIVEIAEAPVAINEHRQLGRVHYAFDARDELGP